MKNIVILFDSDALIKLIKADIFHSIEQECIISKEVYEETVIEGKKRLYEDAYKIEQNIKEGKIKIKKAIHREIIPGLGKGETSTLTLFKKNNSSLIISDDKKFLTLLEQNNIPFIIPTEIIVVLVKTNKINKKEGLDALNRIKEFVSKQNYESAINALGGIE